MAHVGVGGPGTLRTPGRLAEEPPRLVALPAGAPSFVNTEDFSLRKQKMLTDAEEAHESRMQTQLTNTTFASTDSQTT